MPCAGCFFRERLRRLETTTGEVELAETIRANLPGTADWLDAKEGWLGQAMARSS